MTAACMWSAASQPQIISSTDDGFKSKSRNGMFHKRVPSEDQSDVCSFNSLSLRLCLLSTPRLALFRNWFQGAAVWFIHCCVFLFSLNVPRKRTGNFQAEYKAMYIWVTHFSCSTPKVCVCVCVIPPPPGLFTERLSGGWGRLLSLLPHLSLKREPAGRPSYPRGRPGGEVGG